jgi:hypothetical protein
MLLNKVAMSAIANPYTAAIGTTLLKSLPSVIDQIPDISSTHVTID